MKVFLDTSVVLRILLDQPRAFSATGQWEVAVSSELLRVEVMRVFDRLRLKGLLTDVDVAERLALFYRMAGTFQYVPIRPEILVRASSPFRTPVGTLDAIHLATALLWIEENGEPLTFLTHDAELALAARASGLEVKTAP